MSETWLLVEVVDSATRRSPLDGERLHFSVSPKLNVNPESRSVDEFMADASAKGWDAGYGFPSLQYSQRGEEVRKAVVRKVMETHSLQNEFDVSVEIVARATKH